MGFAEYYQETRHTRGIYALKKKKEIVYIGSSSNIYTRILEHKIEGIKDFDTVSTIDLKFKNSGADTARKIFEMGIICKLKPKYNKIYFDNFRFWMYSIPCENIDKKIASMVIKKVDSYICKLEEGGHHGRA